MRASLCLVVVLAAACSSSPEASPPTATDAAAEASPEAAVLAAASYAGEPCSDASSCPKGGSGTTVCLTTGFPGGYCAVMGCADHGHDCPNDPGNGGTPTATSSKCVKYDKSTACLRTCTAESDCRTGHTCVVRDDAAGHGTVRVCLPLAG